MVDDNIIANKFADVSRIFKGYFILYEGTASDAKGHVFNRIVDLTATASQLTSPHYGTFGSKKLAVVGFESEYTVLIDDTADLYPTDNIVGNTSPDATEQVSVSYFLDKLTDNELVPARFATVQETKSIDTEKYIVNEFNGFVTGAGHTRNTGTGTWEREFTFEVIDVVKSHRIAEPTDTIDSKYLKKQAP